MSRTRDVLRQELRAIGLVSEPAQPLPTDLDAEGEVLSAVLCGDVTCSYLEPLSADDFYSSINAAIWRAACDCTPGDVVGIKAALLTRGWKGAIEDELEMLMTTQPFVCLPRLKERAEWIAELAERRRLIRALQRVEGDLRTDRLSVAEARDELRRATS